MLKPQNRRSIATFAVAVLLAQVLIPRGYMPAHLPTGSFVKLCPDGLTPHAVMVLFGAHHHHDHGRADGADSSRPCELGGLYGDAIETSAFVTDLPERQALGTLELNPAPPAGPRIRNFRPRAPPFA